MHPMVASKDPGLMKRRAGTVEYKSCGCLLRNIYMEGDDIIQMLMILKEIKLFNHYFF